MSPKVSVILSVYNGRPYLKFAMNSILEQSFTDFELIVVDDGSTDDTLKELKKFSEQDRRVQVLKNKKNRGIPYSKNRGLSVANGELVVCHDADDISYPHRLSAIIDRFDLDPGVGLVSAFPQYINENGEVYREISFPFPTDNVELQDGLPDRNYLSDGGVAFRNSIYSIVGGYDPNLKYSHDYDLWLRMAEVCKVAVIPDHLYQYRKHSNAVSNRFRYLQMKYKAIALEKAIQRRCGSQPPDNYITYLTRDYVKTAVFSASEGNFSEAKWALDRALHHDPHILEDGEIVREVLDRVIDTMPEFSRTRLLDNIFGELFDDTRSMRQIYRVLTSKIHMKQVYLSSDEGDYGKAGKHLIPGLRNNPAWILNRGVLSILLKIVIDWSKRFLPKPNY